MTVAEIALRLELEKVAPGDTVILHGTGGVSPEIWQRDPENLDRWTGSYCLGQHTTAELAESAIEEGFEKVMVVVGTAFTDPHFHLENTH